MKVAILSPIAWRTPPRLYGPWEQIASNIAEGLVAKGLDVTLFATGDSLPKGKLAYSCEKSYGENPALDVKVEECLHISHLFERAGEFDIIHNHYDFFTAYVLKAGEDPSADNDTRIFFAVDCTGVQKIQRQQSLRFHQQFKPAS